MRTNIIINDELMAEALRFNPVKTKRAVVEEGLKLLIQMKNQEKLRNLKGKLKWEGDLEKMRIDR